MAVTLDELDDGPQVERLHPALQVVVAIAMALMAWALFIGVALYVLIPSYSGLGFGQFLRVVTESVEVPA